MLTRLVKLTISPDKSGTFKQIFNESKEQIRNFEGCLQLKLFTDKKYPNIFFTYSIWDSEEALEKYRNSELFRTTWKRTKVLFAAKPSAWSLDLLYVSET